MKPTKHNITSWWALTLAASISMATASGCANMGMPSGGARDEDPPILVSADPPRGSLNVNKEKITLTFNELVNVKDAFQKVVVSPTSKSTPRVSSSGRRVTVEFDSLAENTTYTIDFADAIEDNNEGNPLQGFTYTFSTGPDIDTLRISGRVLDARNLEPRQNILVGVHSNLNDTAFTGQRLLRVAKTDDRGRFTVRGLAPGSYRVFALDDKDNDFKYSSPEEDIAFHEFIVEPYTQAAVAYDSLYNPKTGELDTVVFRARTQFLPNDIILRTFNSELRQQYMSKYERQDSTRIFLKFNTRADSLPRIRILGREEMQTPGILEASEKLDSLVWWLSPELMRQDTIQLEVAYTRSDQNLVKSPVVDTLNFITNRPKQVKKKEQKKRVSATDSIAALTIKFEPKSGSVVEIDKPIIFEAPEPLLKFDRSTVRLSMLVDSVYEPVADSFVLELADSLQPRRYLLDYPWNYATKYRLEIDTLAATGIYGKPTLPLKYDFSTRDASEYCSILFHLTGLDGAPAFVELLNGSDAVVRTAIVEPNGDAYFPYLLPGKYYARVILDLNSNGEFDTGNYALGLQSELAYYYPKLINIKKNWDKEENWDIFALPVDMMKPMAITKNKPATDRRARARANSRNNLEEEEEEDYFDPSRNPFDPNDRGSRRNYNY